MLISYQKRFIFVHVPKVAGSSIRDAIQRYAYRPDMYLWNRVLRKLGLRARLPASPIYSLSTHSTAGEAKHHLPSEVFAGFFKFAFVRNPWDHLVSKYHFILKRPPHRHYEIVRTLSCFRDYVRWLEENPGEALHGALQKYFVTDHSGQMLVDFLGRYENLQDDFQTACRRVGIHATLPHVNVSKHDDYRAYFDSETIDVVGRLFAPDIKFFGYDFDGVRKGEAA